MEEKIVVERPQFERKKEKAEERIAVMKEKENLAVKLPKLGLKKYHGNILRWTEYWDAYEATIHNNKVLQAVDKLICLKSQLSGRTSESY